MRFRRPVIALVAFGIVSAIGCQGPSSLSPSQSATQLVYVVEGVTVTTYTVDPGTLAPSSVGSVSLLPASASLLQLVPAPDDHVLYALWADSKRQEHLSAFTTDTSGVPQLPSAQMLSVSSVSQLNIHPSGRFAYAIQMDASQGAYLSEILLFRLSGLGRVGLSPSVEGSYGPAPFPTLLYGISPLGNQIYLTSEGANGPEFWKRKVNRAGSLNSAVLVLQPPPKDSVILWANLVIDYQSALNYSQPEYVDILSTERQPPRLLIHCTQAMLAACASATNVHLDPSGHYLFLTDPSAQQVQIARIDFSAKVITDTGNSFPLTATPSGFAFSPDGKLVYALLASDSNLHIYAFDPSTGNLSPGAESIPLPESAAFLPAMH